MGAMSLADQLFHTAVSCAHSFEDAAAALQEAQTIAAARVAEAAREPQPDAKDTYIRALRMIRELHRPEYRKSGVRCLACSSAYPCQSIRAVNVGLS